MPNLATRWVTGGRGEVNGGDKEGKDRSGEEVAMELGRGFAWQRRSEGQM